MEPGISAEELVKTQAVIYQEKQHTGKVALVLGAGNVSCIAPLDILYKLFVEDQVVVLKMNPVNAYLGPLIQESFRALIEPGFLRIAYGGSAEGAYLCNHLEADNVVEYIERAVQFANKHMWGSLNATILVHPKSLKDPLIAAAVELAVVKLRYGTVGVNYWAAAGFMLGVTPWGAFPGHPIEDIQSGNGMVHNTLMFSHPQKSVLRGPFRSVPTPPLFALNAMLDRLPERWQVADVPLEMIQSYIVFGPKRLPLRWGAW